VMSPLLYRLLCWDFRFCMLLIPYRTESLSIIGHIREKRKKKINIQPGLEKFRFDSYSNLLFNSILSGIIRAFLHVRYIPHQNSQWLFWASVW
jgi:hypothetical protein